MENSDKAAEIASTAKKFKDDPEKLELVFANVDKLKEINDFVNEFGGFETSLIRKLENPQKYSFTTMF